MILFLYFAVGVAIGIGFGVTLALLYNDPVATDPGPSRFTHYRGGYHEGHADATDGIWRGGPLP